MCIPMQMSFSPTTSENLHRHFFKLFGIDGSKSMSLLISCFAKAALHIIAGQLSEEKIKAYAGWIDECELMMRCALHSYDFGANAAR